MLGIYKITSPENKIYIGRSTNINERLKQQQQMLETVLSGQQQIQNILRNKSAILQQQPQPQPEKPKKVEEESW